MDEMENRDELQRKYVQLLKDNVDPRKYFTKKKYADYYAEYCKSNQDVFEDLTAALEQLKVQDDKQETCNASQRELLNQLAKAVASYGKEEVNKRRGFSRGNRQAELNLFLITSVFPCTLDLAGEYGEALCEEIIKEWKNAFPQTELGYQDFEKLNGSFRSFWGFLTGR